MEVKLDGIKGVGPQTLKMLRQHNIWSTYDLVLNYPKNYEDFSIQSIEKLHHKDQITIKANVSSPPRMIRGMKVERVIFDIKVFHQTISVIVFGRGYLVKSIALGDQVVIKGTYDLYKHQIQATQVVKAEKNVEIKPLYHLEGLHDKTLSTIVKTIFDEKQVSIYETLPSVLIQKHQFVSREQAYHMLHLPKSFEEIEKAKQRLKYEEAFYIQLKLISKQPIQAMRPPKAYDIHKVKAFIDELPYELTQDQKLAVNDIYRDFKKKHSSYRLIQGDVGSGKTIVALLGAYAIITAHEQVAIMAPTELLARQHYQFFKTYLKDCHIALLTRKTKDKDQLKEDIKNHNIDLVIGTHALIEKDVLFNKLGLIIIDEQHKFGVGTRASLLEKAKTKDVIYLTATPIPRTLAMIAFGNQHVSIIKTKPEHRLPIQTRYITKNTIQELYDMMYSALIRKEHIFLVVPAISSDKVTDNIETVYQEISEEFKCPIFVLHSKIEEDEKEKVMENFMYTPGSIMISTTMIEVGIDLPTATVIGIYAAEHFGLSQLHQLRGRVGRGNLASFCYLISEKEAIERLEVLSKTDDGFKLAEYDLIERGPGDFLGSDQSGYLDFNFLELIEDYPILVQAQKDAYELMERPDFKTNPTYRYLHKYIQASLKI